VRTLVVTYPSLCDDAQRLAGKFLQLGLDGQDCLLFAATARYRYHNQLLARFLADHGIRHRWENDSRLVVDDTGLRVAGGGRYELDAERRSLRVWDNSSVYGRFDEALLARQLRAADAPWRGVELIVE
jgi:hypothetical protein